jgi:hypothetical protein
MTSRPNLHISLSSTDVLIAMLSGDLSGSYGEIARLRCEPRRPVDFAAGSGELPRMTDELLDDIAPALPPPPVHTARAARH